MMNRTAVICHGPNIINKKIGSYIDSFDVVLRIPHFGNWQKSEDYGDKISYYCCSVRRATQSKVYRTHTPYFVWSKRKGRKVYDRLSNGIDVSELIQKWQNKLKTKFHSYFDHGTASILIAADKFSKPITVFGADILGRGENDIKKYTRGDDKEYVKVGGGWHDFKQLRSLIDDISEKYNIEIKFYD